MPRHVIHSGCYVLTPVNLNGPVLSHSMPYCLTEISEQRTAPISCHCFSIFTCLDYSSATKTEVIHSTETSVNLTRYARSIPVPVFFTSLHNLPIFSLICFCQNLIYLGSHKSFSASSINFSLGLLTFILPSESF